MSLAVLAAKVCAVRALTGSTSAGARIFDSAVDPRDLLDKEAAPAIVVYADTGSRSIQGRDLLASDHACELSFEMFVARAVTVKGYDGSTHYELRFPEHDSGLDLYLRTLAYEVETVLLSSSAWAELFRRLVVRATPDQSTVWQRGGDSERGRRFAALRIAYVFDLVAEPPRGGDLPPLWTDVLAAFAADSELSAVARYLRALITTPAAPDWRLAEQALGLTTAAVQSMGVGPVVADPAADEPIPPLAAATVPPWPFDVESIETAIPEPPDA